MNIGQVRWADVAGAPRWSWADVSGIDPLELSFVGTPLDGEPINLAGPLTVGDRVWVQFNPGPGAAMQLLVLARVWS